MESRRKGERVLVAMSGGADSTAAALALLEDGYRVAGVTFLFGHGAAAFEGSLSEADVRQVEAARRAATALGIEHRVIDLREEFRRLVVEPFAAEYLRARTPNPCVECNRRVKFPALLRAADEEGARWVATGHYVRVRENPDGTFSLLRGSDGKKDQSYVLYRLGQEELRRCLFPNGTVTKEEVLTGLASRGIRLENMPESQDICFLAGWDYRDFLAGAWTPGPSWTRGAISSGSTRAWPSTPLGSAGDWGSPHPAPFTW